MIIHINLFNYLHEDRYQLRRLCTRLLYIFYLHTEYMTICHLALTLLTLWATSTNID